MADSRTGDLAARASEQGRPVRPESAANVTAIFDVPVAIFTGRPFETFPELVLCAMSASRMISPRRDAFIRPGRLGAGAALSGAAVLASELARL